MTHWTIKSGSTEQSLADWGFEAGTLTRQNQEMDSLTFAAGALAFDADPILAVGAAVELWRDRTLTEGVGSGGTRVFVGEVVSVPVFASATTEGQSYLAHNAWAALDEMLYEQTWYLAVDPDNLDESLVGGRQSHVVLFQGINGSKLTLGEQITDIVTVATDVGVAMQVSSADVAALTLTPPYDEQRDLTLAEALRRCLRWIPDAVTWWDYATTPPTLHIQRRSNLPTVTMPVVSTDAQLVESAQLRARPDLQAPAVVLKYERVNSVDGVPWRQIVKDIYPVGADEAARGNVVATIDLDGDQVQRSVATIVTRPLAPLTLAWWREHLPGELNNATNFAAGTAAEIGVRFEEDLPNPRFADPRLGGLEELGELTNELVSGQVAPWMGQAQTVTVNIDASWDSTYWGEGEQPFATVLSTRVTVTNLTSGTYTTTTLLIQGEPVPTGLAQRIYEAVSVLPYEGAVTWVAEECPEVGFGLLNLTGGRAAWTTMAALIQQVSQEIETGRTTVTFGPPAHLGPTDLVELVRFNRQRRLTFSWGGRLNGKDPRHEAAALGAQVANHSAQASGHLMRRAAIQLDASGDRSVKLSADGLAPASESPLETMARFHEVTVTKDGTPAVFRVLGQWISA
jgi:hypothetical protein